MRVSYKGCEQNFNFRLAEINFTENELSTLTYRQYGENGELIWISI